MSISTKYAEKKNDKILIFPDLYALKILESFKN